MTDTTLFCYQGSDFAEVLTLQNDNGTPINIANYSFAGVIRNNYYSANAAANLVISITDAANGAALSSLDAANTANLEYGTYLYNIIYVVANITTPLIGGHFIVVPSVIQTQPVTNP